MGPVSETLCSLKYLTMDKFQKFQKASNTMLYWFKLLRECPITRQLIEHTTRMM
jgi:hypothetical protein